MDEWMGGDFGQPRLFSSRDIDIPKRDRVRLLFLIMIPMSAEPLAIGTALYYIHVNPRCAATFSTVPICASTLLARVYLSHCPLEPPSWKWDEWRVVWMDAREPQLSEKNK
jgi:hypothetical protein